MSNDGALAAFVTAVAIALAEETASDDIDLLACIFTQLGDTLATISAQRAKRNASIAERPKDIFQNPTGRKNN